MKFSLRRSPAQTGWCLGDIQMELVGRMVSERRQRKAIEKMQAAAAAAYEKRIGVWFQSGMPGDLRGADGSRLVGVHGAGIKAVLRQFPASHVGARLLMEGACFEVLARHVGRPAGVLAPEVISARANKYFRDAAKEFAEGWKWGFSSMSEDEAGMCFTYAMHRMVRDVGPWPGSDEQLWAAWQRDSLSWLAEKSRTKPESVMSASMRFPDPNYAFDYLYERRSRS